MLFYRCVRAAFRGIAAPYFSFRVEGREHVPAAGAGIVIAPHRSWLDPACVGAASPRPIHFLIAEDIYEKPWSRWFYRMMQGTPVKSGGFASFGSLRGALRVLDRGELVGIFPEGRVIRPGVENDVQAGAALLAVRTGAPVIPVGIVGTARAWPHGRRFPRPSPVRVRIGRPIDTPKGRGRELVAAVHDRIERELRQLGDEADDAARARCESS